MFDKKLGSQIQEIVLKIAKDSLQENDVWQRVNFHLSFNAKKYPNGIRLADFDIQCDVAKSDKVEKAVTAKPWLPNKSRKKAVPQNSVSKNLTSKRVAVQGRPKKG